MDLKYTREKFAEFIGVQSHSTVGEWCRGVRRPTGDHLLAMAVKTGVSTDWLLGLVGADDNAPMYRGQIERRTDFQRELAVTILAKAKQLGDFTPEDLDISAVLSAITQMVRSSLTEWRDYYIDNPDPAIAFAHRVVVQSQNVERLAQRLRGTAGAAIARTAESLRTDANGMTQILPQLQGQFGKFQPRFTSVTGATWQRLAARATAPEARAAKTIETVDALRSLVDGVITTRQVAAKF